MTVIKVEDFKLSFTVAASADKVMQSISRVDLWWANKFKGKAGSLSDEFSVQFGGPGQTFVDFKISECIPDKKVIWLVTDCNLHWINDKKEWNHTEVIWNLYENNGKTEVRFTHKGLTPESECYESCQPGWTHHIKDSLIHLIEKNQGFPE